MSEYLHEYNEHDRLRARLLANVDDSRVGDKTETLEELVVSQTNPEFEEKRLQRMVIGRFRYAKVSEQASGEKSFKNLESLEKRIQLFRETGNGEHLVDVANMCGIIYKLQQHPTWHFESTDDASHHTEAA